MLLFLSAFWRAEQQMVSKAENTIGNSDGSESYTRQWGHKHKAIDGNDDFGKSKFIELNGCVCFACAESVKIYVTSVNASNLIVFSWMSKRVWSGGRCCCCFHCHQPTNQLTDQPTDSFHFRVADSGVCILCVVCVWAFMWWENPKSGYRKIGSRRPKGWIRTLAPIDPNDLIKNIEGKNLFYFSLVSLSVFLLFQFGTKSFLSVSEAMHYVICQRHLCTE